MQRTVTVDDNEELLRIAKEIVGVLRERGYPVRIVEEPQGTTVLAKTEDKDALIEAIIEAYPKRAGQQNYPAARKKLKRYSIATLEEILEGARRYHGFQLAANHIGTRYVPMITTWLNQERWKDDFAPEPALGNSAVDDFERLKK